MRKKKKSVANNLFTTLFLQVVPPGIEPGTQGFSVLCSQDL